VYPLPSTPQSSGFAKYQRRLFRHIPTRKSRHMKTAVKTGWANMAVFSGVPPPAERSPALIPVLVFATRTIDNVPAEFPLQHAPPAAGAAVTTLQNCILSRPRPTRRDTDTHGLGHEEESRFYALVWTIPRGTKSVSHELSFAVSFRPSHTASNPFCMALSFT